MHPLWWLVARFEFHYPGVYFNPQRWPTRDGYIPAVLFLRYSAQIPALDAARQHTAAYAHRLGHLLATAGNDWKVKRAAAALKRLAYPEVTDTANVAD